MRKSSSRPLRKGSAEYWERPSQFWLVLPRLEGLWVMLLFVPTTEPFTYSVPVLPLFVTATCVHTPVGSADEPVICCSAPLPLVVMAKRMALVEPFCGVRNILTVVPVPKSKMRFQPLEVLRKTQVAIEKSLRLLTIPP